MESITHIVLGATMGEVMAGKKIGKKAMLIGAIAQSIPDFDFVAGLWMSPSHYFLAHRGFTHSFLFIVLAALLLPFVVNHFQSTKLEYLKWMLFFFIELLAHILLDSLNAYGVAWLEPFSHHRFSFDVLFVADPFYTLWPLIASVALLILKTTSPSRLKWAFTGIALSCIYILYAASNKSNVDRVVKESLREERIPAQDFLTTPTPLNTWLWYVVAKSTDGYWIGYQSVFDSKPTAYYYFNRNDSLITAQQLVDVETNRLIRLSRDYYLIQQRSDTLVFSNLRFGQMFGWENPAAPFVFQYYLGKPNSLLTVQRGRFSDWDKKKLFNFLDRIKGN